jgi:hypothetical protein
MKASGVIQEGVGDWNKRRRFPLLHISARNTLAIGIRKNNLDLVGTKAVQE